MEYLKYIFLSYHTHESGNLMSLILFILAILHEILRNAEGLVHLTVTDPDSIVNLDYYNPGDLGVAIAN